MNVSEAKSSSEEKTSLMPFPPPGNTQRIKNVTMVSTTIFLKPYEIYSCNPTNGTYNVVGMAGIVSLTQNRVIELLVPAKQLSSPTGYYSLIDGDRFDILFECARPDDLRVTQVLIPFGKIEGTRLDIDIGKVRVPTEDDALFVMVDATEIIPLSDKCLLKVGKTEFPFTYTEPNNLHQGKVLFRINRTYREILLHLST